jgi:molybdopterin converting factor small subunit
LSAATVAVRVPGALRSLTAGQPLVQLDVEDGVTVADLLDLLAAAHPALEPRVRDEQGRLRAHVNVFVGADNIRDLDGVATRVACGAEVTILPAVSGG